MQESGLLTTPIALTNTHSVGAVHEALAAAALAGDRSTWSLPVVAETWTGVLNDVNGFHVRPEHARAALESDRTGGAPPAGSAEPALLCSDRGDGGGDRQRALGRRDDDAAAPARPSTPSSP